MRIQHRDINCTCMLAYSEINTVIPEINVLFKKMGTSSHPSVRIVKKIVIFVNTINIPNGTSKYRQTVLVKIINTL